VTHELRQNWDHLWHTEAQRLQKELVSIESRKFFLEEDRNRLRDSLTTAEAGKEKFRAENTILRRERDQLQAQVDVLLSHQIDWILEQGELAALRAKFDRLT
jgi:uncharacterized protein involved in exopolysaccharide biosynthesis